MSEYIIKQSFGAIWHFCHNSRGICFCTMTDEHIREYEILLKNGQKDFDVLIDDADIIHLVCQDNEGNIIYIKNEEKNWKKYTVMQSKTPSAYKKNFNIQRVGSWINIIYAIDYKGKKLLSHQIIDGSEVPYAVDYIEGDFSVCADDDGNIYVLYVNINGETGWRRFTWSRKEWGEFSAARGRLESPYIYVDNKIHMAGVAENSIVYISDSSEQVIAETGSKPIILRNEGYLYIMWENKHDGKVWVSLSSDNGNTFQSPTEFMAGKFAPIKLFRLAYTSHESISARHCYGYIRDNIISLYMLGNFLKVSRLPVRPATPQNHTEGNLELTKLKIQLTQLDESLSRLSRRMDAIEKDAKKSPVD